MIQYSSLSKQAYIKVRSANSKNRLIMSLKQLTVMLQKQTLLKIQRRKPGHLMK